MSKKGCPLRFTQEQMIRALTEARGLKMVAAEALHCDRATVHRYILRYPKVRQAYEEAIEGSIDLAQSKLITLIEREDWRAIRFMLCTLGKDRGFTERHEIAAPGDDLETLRRQFFDDMARIYGDEDDAA